MSVPCSRKVKRRPWLQEQGEVEAGVFVPGPRPSQKARSRLPQAVQPETSHANMVDIISGTEHGPTDQAEPG